MTTWLTFCTTLLATFAAADQGLAVAELPCWGRLGRRRQLRVAMTFSSSPKTRLPESCPFSAGDWISIPGLWTIWALLNLGRGNSIPASYLFQGMPSNTCSFPTDEENKSLDHTECCPKPRLSFEMQVHWALEMNATVIFRHVPEFWGPIVYFSTLLSVQSTTSFVASQYL